jgi:hypothetical protein
MLRGKTVKHILGVTAVLMLAGPAVAQWVFLGKFKRTEIPYTLKYQDKVIEKGVYDIEAVKNPATPQCYLRFKKGDELIAFVEGEQLMLPIRGVARASDPSIPNTPRMKMKRDTENKLLIIMVETGRRSPRPYLLIRFKIEYVE